MGRKSTFNQKDADEIVERLSKGEPLAQICRDDWLPAYRTVYDWMDAHPSFAASIARAREIGFDVIAADCLTIADSPNTTMNKDTGEAEMRDPARDRLRVETRLKLLAKWDPRRYGDKVQTEVSGPDGGPIKTDATHRLDASDLTDEQLRALASIQLPAG